MDVLKTNGMQFKPLVVLTADSEVTQSDSLTDKVEAAFRIPDFRGLWLDTRSWSNEAANFFAARSARTPENLLNHVQRIMHHIKRNDTDGVYGALIDLFIVLKNHGTSLRERMLNYARPLLDEAQYDSLYRLLSEDVSTLDQLPSGNCSILSKGFSGTFKLVEKLDSSPQSEQKDLEGSSQQ